jgi:hypothetical protein
LGDLDGLRSAGASPHMSSPGPGMRWRLSLSPHSGTEWVQVVGHDVLRHLASWDRVPLRATLLRWAEISTDGHDHARAVELVRLVDWSLLQCDRAVWEASVDGDRRRSRESTGPVRETHSQRLRLRLRASGRMLRDSLRWSDGRGGASRSRLA